MVTEVTLSPDGKMQNIKVIRSKFSPETEKCVLDILKNSPYPPFLGDSVTINYNVVM
ncbi:MAG: energy transducer TonB [Proteobacteria bacterium]|nr:energy transducer TonB [Pseudomonadota bacterium]